MGEQDISDGQNNQGLDKRERRELKHQAEEQQLASRQAQRKLKRTLLWIGFVVILAWAGWGIYKWAKNSEASKPGESVPIQPAEHINPGDPLPGLYLTNPPVSGWHYAQTAEWGIYDKELVDQNVIHNLEHGGIWISYRPDAPPELIAQLKEVAGRYN